MKKTQRSSPNENKPIDFFKTLGKLFTFTIKYHRLLLVHFLVVLVSIGCELAIPLAIRNTIDSIFYPGQPPVLAGILTFLSIVVLSCVFGYFQGLINGKISLRLEKQWRDQALEKCTKMPVGIFESYRKGDLISRFSNDVSRASQAYTEFLCSLFSSVVVIVGSAVIMFIQCPDLAVITICGALLSVILVGTVSKLLLPRYQKQQALLGEMNSVLEESLTNIRDISQLSAQKDWQHRFLTTNKKFYSGRIKTTAVEGAMGPLMLLLGNLNFIIVAICGVVFMLRGVITFGMVQAFLLYSKEFMEPVNSLGEVITQVQSSVASAERIFELLQEKEEDEAGCDTFAEKQDVCISFQDVHFGYKKNIPVLKGVSFTINKGQNVALVGETGAGKTTIINLLLRFFDRYRGQIQLWGTDIQSIRPDALRKSVGVVTQIPFITQGTVYDNLVYGNPQADRALVQELCSKTGLMEYIRKMPQGFETPVQDWDAELSDEMYQMISIVRALLQDTDILVLDEATNSLDSLTESQMFAGIRDYVKGKTCITIAHRISAASQWDLILVIKDGVVAEAGTHQELLEKKGHYHCLFQKQLIEAGP